MSIRQHRRTVDPDGTIRIYARTIKGWVQVASGQSAGEVNRELAKWHRRRAAAKEGKDVE